MEDLSRETVPTEDPCSCCNCKLPAAVLIWTGNLCSVVLTAWPAPLALRSFKHMLECLQHQGQMCVLLWGASSWQSAGDRRISNISWGFAFLGILRKEIHVPELTDAYGHPAETTYLLWSVPLSCKIQSSEASLSRGHFSFFRRLDLRLTGFRKYFFFFPFRPVRSVVLSPQGFSDVFACLRMLEVLDRMLFWILKVTIDISYKVSPWS